MQKKEKKRCMSFTVCDKVDNLSKVDAHTGMCGDLALKLCTSNKTEKCKANDGSSFQFETFSVQQK